MADEQNGTQLTHPLTQALHPEPDRFGDRATVVGYPGPSPRQGRLRVYHDPTFTSYYELDEEAVVQTVPARAEDENSPTVVVLAADAQVDVVRVQTGTTEARFLEGSITSGHLSSARATTAPTRLLPCECIMSVALTTALTGQNLAARPAKDDCICVLGSLIVNTAAAQQNLAARQLKDDCICVLGSLIVNTAAAQQNVAARQLKDDCICVLGSLIVNTAAAQQNVAGRQLKDDCICVLGSLIVNTAAAQQNVAGRQLKDDCICVLGSLIVNTAAGQQNLAADPAAACLQLGATTVCTPTGVQWVCPG